MASIFTLDNFQDFSENINIDELYNKKKQKNLNELELFKKILNRIHIRIRTTARLNVDNTCCWFVVPEIIIGMPKFEQARCIAYVMDILQTNGFKVKYFHPNTLLISWSHWVPSYVRNEIKKKTGLNINEYGETIKEQDEEAENTIIQEQTNNNTKKNKTYKPIQSYQPSGKLVYNNELLYANQK